MANLPKGGCMTQASIMRDVWDPLGLHLNQKDLKSGKKWLSYGQITNPKRVPIAFGRITVCQNVFPLQNTDLFPF